MTDSTVKPVIPLDTEVVDRVHLEVVVAAGVEVVMTITSEVEADI